MNKRIRLKDVAERAGVAVNTASTILNRRPNSWASKETEARVFQAARELGYRPSKTARALRSGRYHTIGLAHALDARRFAEWYDVHAGGNVALSLPAVTLLMIALLGLFVLLSIKRLRRMDVP